MEQRKGGADEVGVAVVEGEPHQVPSLTTGASGEKVAHGHAPQPPPAQPLQLESEPFGRHCDAVGVVGTVTDGVVHRHPWHGAAQRDEPGTGAGGFNGRGHVRAFVSRCGRSGARE
ncbi:hypothetical protein GCM10010510_33910 [Streptomyces anandii JCM 4720]|nr:hypothetical protein GCM10010510_33910 [Streptomyces anandii JCM 4720]